MATQHGAALNAPELFAEQWLQGQLLYAVYFATIKKGTPVSVLFLF